MKLQRSLRCLSGQETDSVDPVAEVSGPVAQAEGSLPGEQWWPRDGELVLRMHLSVCGRV